MTLKPLIPLLCAGLMAATAGLAHADSGPKVLKKVAPEFPEEASQRGVTEGVLTAKLSLDASGGVTAVEIVDAKPVRAKVFAPAATKALSKWQFDVGGKAQATEVKLVFQSE